jgi:LuxR family transcriptional regulator, maltose regulon positive regulatory protein
MAKPPAMSPPTASLAGRDGLLATKLHIPRARPGFVLRPRLLERLQEGMDQQVVLVCTPAGFGKTSLLADWARRSGRAIAWLSLDEADNDPARFWRHVVATLEGIRPGVGERLAPLLGPPAPRSFEGLVTALLNQLAAQPDEVVLVLDDYHRVEAQPVHGSLGFLVEHLPPQVRLVVASRADPPLPLARLRAGGQLAELREADLHFTLEEAAELLREAVGPDLSLPEAAVAALAARTEGWAVGLQLAALSLRGRVDADQFVAAFSGSHRYVLDYLAEEVLARQPAELVEFLLATSVLERLSGPLCEAVTGRTDSQALLEQVERANLFLVPLDEVRGWWRYHQLFADLLRARLQQQQPERVPQLHRSAAAWCEAQGLVDDAIRHALAAGDASWAARLVERHFEAVLGRREDTTLRRWLQGLPAEVVRSRPRLCLAQAFWALISGHVETVERLLDDAERSFADAGDEPYEPTVGRDASLLANVPAAIARMRASVAQLRGDPEQTITFARRALAELDEGEWMLESVTRWNLIAAEWLAGRPAAAERAFTSNLASIAAWRRTGRATLATWGYYHLGQVQRAQGRLGAALGTYQEALEATAKPGRPAMPAAGVAHVGIAEVAYERDELDRALHHATEGVALSRQIGWTLPLVAGLTILARIRRAQGDHVGALTAIREAEQVRQSDAVVGLLNPLPVVQARLALARGEVAEATRWVQQRGLAVEDQPSYPREPEYLILVRVLLAQQAPQPALGLLGRLNALAAAQGRTGSVIEVRALQALTLSAGGDQPGALATLGEALTLAAPEGYLRVFVDEGAPMAALLGKLLTAGRAPAAAAGELPPDYLARLTEAFEQADQAVLPQSRRAAPQPGLVVPLTSRELEVLRLLATGKPNPAIAAELVISLDTVKRHVTHILDKLQAANRTQAVIRARELGLLR